MAPFTAHVDRTVTHRLTGSPARFTGGRARPGGSRQNRTPAVAKPSPQAEQLRSVETLVVRRCISPSRRRPRPHDGEFYREIDGPAGPRRSRTQHRVEPFEQLGDHDVEPPAKPLSRRSCRPWAGPEACVIVTHDAETGEKLWRQLVCPGEPGDETWGEVPYEDRVHAGSWTAPSVDLDLTLVFVGTSATSQPRSSCGAHQNTHLDRHPFKRLLATPQSPQALHRHPDQPSPAAGRGAAGDDRHPGQDRGRQRH